MLTLPAAFAALKDREATGACFILTLTHATLGTVRLSTGSIHLTAEGIQVEGIIREFGVISQTIDLDDHSYGASSATVTLSSGWTRRSATGDWTRIVDVIQGCWGRQAQIHVFPGGYATSLNDLLLIFDGTVTRFVNHGDGGLTIEIDERFKILHRPLPQRLATRAIFPDLPEDQINKRMPLAYGQPAEGNLYFKQTGFFPGMLISDGPTTRKYLIADHTCVSPGSVAWIGLPAVDSWGRSYNGTTANVSDTSGLDLIPRTSLVLDPLTLQFRAIVFPTGGKATSTAVDAGNPVGPRAAFDNDGATKVSVIAETGSSASIVFEWGQNGDSSTDRRTNSVASFDSAPARPGGLGYRLLYHRSLAVTPTSQSIYYWNGTTWLVFMNTQSGSIMADADFWTGPPGGWDYSNPQSGVLWHLGSGPTGGDGLPFRIMFWYENAAGTWTPNVTVVAYIHEVYLALACVWPTHDVFSKIYTYGHADPITLKRLLGKRTLRWSWHLDRTDVLESSLETASLGMDGTYGGRMYGSWIDEGGRSNTLNAGQPITTAAGIIESLLRDELGLTSAQIDYTSFDTIHNTYPSTAYLSLMDSNATGSEEIIRTLCWEHGYFLLRTPTGTLKLVNYLGTGVGGTIYPWHLDELPEVQEVAVTGPFKRATVNHTRLPHDNKYKRTFDVVDGNPSVLNDAIKGTIDLETIRSLVSAPTLRVVTRLFGTERLMSQPHFIVTLRTTGIRWIAMEIGDLFTLDATLFDPQLKLMGQSWSGKSLMIFQKEIREGGVDFSCIYWTPAPL